MRSRILGALLIALAALTVCAAPAGAVVTNTPHGRVSYLPLNEPAAGGSAPIHAAIPEGEPPLEYHGGPVMHSQTAYAIFWAPSGFSFPAGYETAITDYLKNVAADSGKSTNVYSVSAQYSDQSGLHATYSDSFGGSVTDSTAYPTSGTCAPYTGLHSESFTACISDAKLQAEVDTVVTAQSWPHGLGAEYYVVLPPHAGSCTDTLGTQCFDKQFCAYHSFIDSSETVYANISYSPSDVSACGVGEYPNGHANGNVDDVLSSLSHEANESITDPTLEAWFDEAGFENGDECRNTLDDEDFGAPLGGSAGALFNQAISAGHYYLQREWSNDIEDCAQRVEPPTPAIADPGQVAPGEAVSFNGAGSVPGSGGIVAYEWDFGDGHTATGPTPSHTFTSEGDFEVTLTVEDDGGFTFSTIRHVTVETLSRELTVSLAGTGSGTVTGVGISCPGACSHGYPVGESVTLTAAPAAGSTFAGWSGAGCGGVGTCHLTMSEDRLVTATFTGSPSGGTTQPAGVGPTPPAPPAAAPAPVTKTLKCKKGFRKIRKHGKKICVRVKKKHG
jgi:hypothetical protein